ncbi:hypothetical protein [Winogradskyella sp.]|uniref:hypothetical protein n=1 Tax=Winogradskyella sp. TaxID=1883156 RepID=UPI003BAD317E
MNNIEREINKIEYCFKSIVGRIITNKMASCYSKTFNTKILKPFQYGKDINDQDWYSPNTDSDFRYFFEELDLKKNHCLYWFELESNDKANALNILLNNYRREKGIKHNRVVPATNKNENSNVLYVGIRRGALKPKIPTNIVGRINQHLGYYKVTSTQGLQLVHYARGLDFEITLNVVEFEGLDNPIYLNIIEKMMADKLKPLCGRH